MKGLNQNQAHSESTEASTSQNVLPQWTAQCFSCLLKVFDFFNELPFRSVLSFMEQISFSGKHRSCFLTEIVYLSSLLNGI